MTRKRLGFFTRLLDDAAPKERYRLATEQIRHAERYGFDSAWIAQHHFHEHEGGLPSPLVFLAHVAAHTETIRLGTAIITLPLENPLRVAEDAAVLDLLADGRLEVGFGSGGTATSFLPFGLTIDERATVFADALHLIQSAWRGDSLTHPDNHLYPPAPQLAERIWIATFSVDGAIRAGRGGHGLMLSRTQPRPADNPSLTLDAIQNPMVDAYLDALPAGVAPRILASRTAFVADSRDYALKIAAPGLTRQPRNIARQAMWYWVTTSLIISASLMRISAMHKRCSHRWRRTPSCARHRYLFSSAFRRTVAPRHVTFH